VAAGLAQRHGGATAYLGGGDGGIQTIEERRLWTGRSKRWRGGRGIGGAVGAARAAVGTRTRHGPDSAFMVWRARGHRRMQPRGDGALMSGSGAERKRLIGGIPRQ
jgi:hypothetical protein